MLTIKKVNEITIKNNTCSIDYIEFFEDEGCDYRTVIDLDLNWLTSYIHNNYGLTVQDWTEKVTHEQLSQLFYFINVTCCDLFYFINVTYRNCVDYCNGRSVK